MFADHHLLVLMADVTFDFVLERTGTSVGDEVDDNDIPINGKRVCQLLRRPTQWGVALVGGCTPEKFFLFSIKISMCR